MGWSIFWRKCTIRKFFNQLLCVVHRLVCRKSAKYIFRKFQLKISKRLSPTSNQQVPGIIGIGGKGIKGSTVKLQSSVISMHLFNAGPSEGLKIRGCQYYLLGIICPLGWDRVNWSAKIWGCHGTPGTPRDDTPEKYAAKKETMATFGVNTM